MPSFSSSLKVENSSEALINETNAKSSKISGKGNEIILGRSIKIIKNINGRGLIRWERFRCGENIQEDILNILNNVNIKNYFENSTHNLKKQRTTPRTDQYGDS